MPSFKCPSCSTRVAPTSEGVCPSCRKPIAPEVIEAARSAQPPRSPRPALRAESATPTGPAARPEPAAHPESSQSAAPPPTGSPVSAGLLIGTTIAGFVLSYACSVGSQIALARSEEETALGLAFFGLVPLLPAVCALIGFVYLMWWAIQDGPARTTPGRAVGFMFIPLFNLYWVFQVYWGWAKDFNALVDERGIETPRVPEGVALAFCILTIVGMIPLVGLVLSPVSLVLLAVYMTRAATGIRALAAADDTRRLVIIARNRGASRFVRYALIGATALMLTCLGGYLLVRAQPSEIERPIVPLF